MTSNGSEVRFWLYLDTTNQLAPHRGLRRRRGRCRPRLPAPVRHRTARSTSSPTAPASTGYTTGAFTPVGTYTTGWTQYRIVYTFSGTGAQTYTLSKRASRVRRLDAAQGRRRHRLRHPVARHQHHHRHPRHALARPGQRAAVARRPGYSDGGITEADTTPPGRPGRSCRHRAAPRQVALSWSGQHRTRPGRLPRLPRRRQAHPSRPCTATSYTDFGLHRRHATPTGSLPSTPPATRARKSPRSRLAGHRHRLRAGATLVDAGFETGTDGAHLASPPWTASGTPQHREYDTARAKIGTKSAWIQGAAAGSNAGVFETASGGHDRQRLRDPLLALPRHHQPARASSRTTPPAWPPPTAPSSSSSPPTAPINVFTDRAGATGYTTGAFTPVGTYTTGWTQYRIVYTFSGTGAQTYTLSKRASATDPWTQLKAAGAATATPSRCAAPTPSPPPTARSGAAWAARSCGSTTWPTPSAASPSADTTPPTAPAGLAA